MQDHAESDDAIASNGCPSEGQLLADAVMTFFAEGDGSSASRNEALISGLRAAWSPERLSRLVGPDIGLLRRLEYVRTIIVEHHGYRRLRGISVGVADFDGAPVRIASRTAIEVDRRAIDEQPPETLRVAMLDAMLQVDDAATRSTMIARSA